MRDYIYLSQKTRRADGDCPFDWTDQYKELYKFVPVEGRRWKNVDNEISETFPAGTRRTRFILAQHSKLRKRCRRYVTAYVSFVNKRTSIRPSRRACSSSISYPFNDGNGRSARWMKQ
ncbi:hypothetical protein [Exiguobacterium sp.]|uniref:hypothetical protein n=1 Tax=Exiguobacterium sp. TaxID=44751 RepID=UPI0028B0F603|nr:hypothetical protein [Exiguobacterium sp.]